MASSHVQRARFTATSNSFKEIIIYVLVKDCATEPGRNVLSPAYGTLASKVESFFASKDSDDSVASKHHYI